MMTMDYYVILGVSRTESTSGIREAFRDLVKRYHPDRVGPQGARFFRTLWKPIRSSPTQNEESSTIKVSAMLRAAQNRSPRLSSSVNGPSPNLWCPSPCQS